MLDESFNLSEGSERFSLTDVATRLGMSVATVRRLVTGGRLKAIKVLHGDRPRWEVAADELQRFFDERSEEFEAFTLETELKPSKTSEKASLLSVKPSEPLEASQQNASSVPLTAHLAALDLAERLRVQVDEERSRTEAERARGEAERGRADQERRRAETAERTALAMQLQLRQYQVTLAEQAESLVEERAQRQAAEARVAAVLPSGLPSQLLPTRKRRGFWAWLRGSAASGESTEVG